MRRELSDFYAFWSGWFDLPLEEKMKHEREPGKGGYYPLASEGPGLAGVKDAGKEYFHWRPGQGHPDQGVGGERATKTELLFWSCFAIAEKWMLDHGMHEVAAAVSPTDCVLRILHYLPSSEPVVGQAHKDFDLLTVSVEGTHPGLEVLKHAREWGAGEWVSQETGIQVGEMLEIYTEQRCEPSFRDWPHVATTHRVRTEPHVERYKAVFFYLPPNDFELRPGFTAGDYLKDVLTKAGTYK